MRARHLLAALALLALAAALALYPRSPDRQAARARAALAGAREARAHRLAPEIYRRAELAYVEAARLIGRQRERWIPSYREAELGLERCLLLAERALELSRLRDPERERQALETDLATLEDSIESIRLETLWLAAEGRLGPETVAESEALVDALRRRAADVAEALAEGDYPEALARAEATRAQVEAARVLLADLALRERDG